MTHPTAPPEQTSPLLSNLRFVRFVAGKFLQLMAQNALAYGLFILFIQKEPSSLATSVFILASVIPSIVLSLPGGVTADALPAKATILVTLGLRTTAVGLFLVYEPTVSSILLISALLWSLYQFYTPGENAALPSLIPATQMASAASLLHGASLLAQMCGAALLAPIALKVFGVDGLFAIVLAFMCTAFIFLAAVPDLTPPGRQTGQRASRSFGALFRGMRTIRSNALLTRATAVRVVIDTVFMMLVVSIPVLMRDVLHTSPVNAVYVVSPGAIGIAVGLLVSPLLARVWVRGVLWTGYLLVVLCVLGLVFLPELARALDEDTFLPLAWFQSTFGVNREIATMALLLPAGGLAITCVQVAARTAVYAIAPGQMIAQVFATQSAIGSVAALVPTVLAGLLLDLFSIRVVLAVIELTLVASLLWVVVDSKAHHETQLHGG